MKESTDFFHFSLFTASERVNRVKDKKDRVTSPQMRLSFGEEARIRQEDAAPVRCAGCGKRFSQPKWYVEKGIQSRFCSAACRSHLDMEAVDQPVEVCLEGRPEYRGGNWQGQARKARARDGFCCQGCGISEEALGRQLDVHHKVPFRLFESPLEANRLNNLISLCPSCHKKLEERGRDDMPLFDAVKHPGQRS